jgi:hypothetical protein
MAAIAADYVLVYVDALQQDSQGYRPVSSRIIALA